MMETSYGICSGMVRVTRTMEGRRVWMMQDPKLDHAEHFPPLYTTLTKITLHP
jgi:hypothetical protein